MSSMLTLALLVLLLALAVVAPLLGTDSTDSRAQDARPPQGWWPGGPSTRGV